MLPCDNPDPYQGCTPRAFTAATGFALVAMYAACLALAGAAVWLVGRLP